MGKRKNDSRWWWMRKYRDWEANRKEFIYPENYIDPEVRDHETASVEGLERMLPQDERTPE